MRPAVRQLLGAGPNLALNGGFDADTDWSKGTGWTISGGAANFTATGSTSNLTQALGLVAGGFYAVKITVTVAAGSFNVLCGNGGGAGSNAAFNMSGTYTARLRCSGNGTLILQATATFTGTLDSVSCRRVG